MPDENNLLTDRPLLSFVLIAYKQEGFIREAVEGAFSQSYSPLEIILSDDCSPDKTFEIMEEMVASYQGPHKIVLNQTSSNMGLSGHLNQAFNLSTGSLIVAAAGDDISMSHRVESLYEAWESYDKPSMICSGWVDIDEKSETPSVPKRRPMRKSLESGKNNVKGIQDLLDEKGPMFLGASAAYSRELIDFREIDSGITSEDFLLCLRSHLLNGVLSIEEPLLFYRYHENNLANVGGSRVDRFSKWSVLHSASVESFYEDVKCSLNSDYPMPISDYKQVEAKIKAWVRSTPIMRVWNQSTLLTKLLWLVPRLLLTGSKRHRRFVVNYVVRTFNLKPSYAFLKRILSSA